MRTRSARSKRVAHVGRTKQHNPMRWALILSVPTLSLLLPALAVAIASAGGTSQLSRTAGDIARFLLFYSGVFALIALTAAVAAGLLAADRTLMTPDRRIFAQALHRTISLIAVSALANHIMLEVLAHRARLIDGFVPFMAARNTFYMGLGTVASDLLIVIIITGALRKRFTKGARPWVWRALHVTAYAAWPFAVLHGLLAGRSAKPYVDWSYGACLAAVALALTYRFVVAQRGRSAAEPGRGTRPSTVPAWTGGEQAGTVQQWAGTVQRQAGLTPLPPPRVPGRPMRALPPGQGPGYGREW